MMKKCVIWLLLIHLCSCERFDYSDYYPGTIPLRENPSQEYKVVMKNLCDNWRSPINYLKKRGYMPNNIPIEHKSNFYYNKRFSKDIDKGENYFSLPDNNQENPRSTILRVENEETVDKTDAEPSKTIDDTIKTLEGTMKSTGTESAQNDSKADNKTVIAKVREKFMSIFSHKKKKSDQVEEPFYQDDSEFLEKGENGENGDNGENEVYDKRLFPRSVPHNSTNNPAGNLTENENRFINNFINWFKQNKNDFKYLFPCNGTANKSNAKDKIEDKKSEASKTTTESSKVTSTSTTKKMNMGGECGLMQDEQQTTTAKPVNSKKVTTATAIPEKNSCNCSTSKNETCGMDDLTVDLDLNQKNGTGEVTMGSGKTTECVPLRLNDMSFDLEWNKLNSAPKIRQENVPGQKQSLASKFLQEDLSLSQNNEEYLKTPYSDNFLDSQQTLPIGLELPVRISTKREVGSAGYSYPEYEDDSRKRRIKNRVKSNKKKSKHIDLEDDQLELKDLNSSDDKKERLDFDSFDELKDIQFMVNTDDEEAIATFISSLNSPPEVFSFDVDKYLETAKERMEPKSIEEYQPPDQRTYYEFMEAPAIENEILPLIEAMPDSHIDQGVNKRGKDIHHNPRKRDLLRQYIKGVSSAIENKLYNPPSRNMEKDESNIQKSTNLDKEVEIRTNNLIDRFSTNLYAMNSIKSDEYNDSNDSLENYYLLNDGSARIEPPRRSDEVVPSDYSAQGLEIDLDLEKKFRDLNFRKCREESLRKSNAKIIDKIAEENGGVIQDLSDLEIADNDQF